MAAAILQLLEPGLEQACTTYREVLKLCPISSMPDGGAACLHQVNCGMRRAVKALSTAPWARGSSPAQNCCAGAQPTASFGHGCQQHRGPVAAVQRKIAAQVRSCHLRTWLARV
jgi:hypothetical protein